MLLEEKRHLILRLVEKEAIIRGGVTYPCNNRSLIEYASTINPGDDDVFTEPGGETTEPRRQFNLLPAQAQRLYRRLILLVQDLFNSGLTLNKLSEDTFTIDSESEFPQLSHNAFLYDLVELDPLTRDQQMDMTISLLADLMENCIGSTDPVPEEVRDGLLPLMRNTGCSGMLYVITNHSSLVPLENRLELNFRMYVLIKDVLKKQEPTQYRQVLSEIDFPLDWRELIDHNSFMSQFLKGSTYKRTETDPVMIALQVLHYKRNSSAHGMEKAVNSVSLQLDFTRIQIAQMFYATMPMIMHSTMVALHRHDRLRELRIETLFC